MFQSIQSRIKSILLVALILVTVMGTMTLYYFFNISNYVEVLIGTDITIERSAYHLKSQYYGLVNWEKDFLAWLRKDLSTEENQAYIPDQFLTFLASYKLNVDKNLDQKINERNKERLGELKKNLDTYFAKIHEAISNKIAGKNTLYFNLKRDLKGLTDKQDQIISEFLADRFDRFRDHKNELKIHVDNANKTLIFLISLAMIAGGAMIYLAPQRVAQPIYGYVNAIKELRDLKFDTRLPIRTKNELAELGQEINLFIDSMVIFDEKKEKRIKFEKRKFQVLADILNLGVVVLSKEGQILLLNTQMARFLNMTSEEFENKDYHFLRLPDALKELFEDAITKKEKFENRMVILTYTARTEDGQLQDDAIELLVDAGMVRNYYGEVANIILTFEDISHQQACDSIFKRVSFSRSENNQSHL